MSQTNCLPLRHFPAADSGAHWTLTPAAAALKSSAIRDLLTLTERPGILSFAGGLPAAQTFPAIALRAAADRILRDDPVGALQYGPTEGYQRLREQIAARLSADGPPTDAEDILITTGSQQALDLIGRALLNPGRSLLASDPSYLGALQAFALQQPRVLPFDVDADTPLPDAGAAVAYLTPNFANPTGATLSADRRMSLMRRLDAAGIVLIEDDPYGDLWFDAAPPRPCRALAPTRTLYLGSFSKILAPGLRVGYIAGPASLIASLARIKQACDLHTPSLNQRLVSTLIDDGTLDRHLPGLRTFYRRQRDALAAALQRHLCGQATASLPAGGMFFWLTLTRPIDTRRLLDAALARNVAFVPGAPFHLSGTGLNTLRLAFSTVPAEQMDDAMARLSDAIETLPAAPGAYE